MMEKSAFQQEWEKQKRISSLEDFCLFWKSIKKRNE